MSRTIEVLPDAVANQIAAGEVVERPASVVKELVENALDAGATRVEVAIERGGKRRIRVSDDGVGMSREDAILSLDRHATSKIRSADDLRGVRSLGFRGEALPSIAAVSRMRLESRAAGEDVGTLVRVEAGRIAEVAERPRRRGTTVEVERLFHTAPARAKFLRSVAVEARAVSETVTSLALANPSVSFLLTSDDRTLLDLSGSREVADRVAGIWGEEAASALLPVAGSRDELEVGGLIQRPDAARAGMRRGHLFVNGRPFREPALLEAVDRGYRTTVAEGVRPWAFLYLRVPGGAVDVNVHPAKAEVRFRDRGPVEELVEDSVRTALAGEGSAALFGRSGPPPPRVGEPAPGWSAGGEGAGAVDGGGRADDPPRTGEGRKGGGGDRGRAAARDGESQMALFLAGEASAAPETEEPPPVPALPPRLWQVLDTYILAETRDGLLIIDQHSAHERVLFERLMRAFEKGGQTGQRLLFPLTLRLQPAEFEQVDELGGVLERAGFEVEGFGGDTVIVHAVPDPHPYFDPERCFREMIAELTEGSELVRSARNQHERIAKTFACKGSVKAGQTLSPEEMQELFDHLFATELPYHDVHGRPTIVRLGRDELERKFGR